MKYSDKSLIAYYKILLNTKLTDNSNTDANSNNYHKTFSYFIKIMK